MADFNRKVVGIDVDVNTKINKKGIDDLLRQLQALKNLTGFNQRRNCRKFKSSK